MQFEGLTLNTSSNGNNQNSTKNSPKIYSSYFKTFIWNKSTLLVKKSNKPFFVKTENPDKTHGPRPEIWCNCIGRIWYEIHYAQIHCPRATENPDKLIFQEHKFDEALLDVSSRKFTFYKPKAQSPLREFIGYRIYLWHPIPF